MITDVTVFNVGVHSNVEGGKASHPGQPVNSS